MKAYLDALASAAPTPGGGSASAIAGSMAAALVVMVCRVTMGKDKYQCVAEELRVVENEAGQLKARLQDLAAQDEEAFKGVISAFHFPRANDVERELRQRAIQSALKQATEIPLETARVCGKVLQLADHIVDIINPNALSDLGTAVALAAAAVQGARLNVIINARSLDDASYSNLVSLEVEGLAGTADRLRESVQSDVLQRFFDKRETAC